eukprot:14109847-Alexandrium_andersonii.AAC.1
MSASLVGSEMCIRDSADDALMSVTMLRMLRRLMTRALTLNVMVRGPVSYTHLTLPTICSV